MSSAKKRPAAKSAAKEAGPGAVVVKGLTAAEVAALDAITERRRAEAEAQGFTTSRNATILRALREFIAAHAAPAPEGRAL